jgi:hypothetical protein
MSMMTSHQPWTRTERWNFVRHYLEMVVAMMLGMMVLGPLESALLDPLNWESVLAVAELEALVMATNMTVAMVAWMRFRGHGWAANAQMAAVMYLSFVVLFPLMWLDAISADGMLVGGHVLMLIAMAGTMLLRRDEYAGHAAHHHEAASARRE